MDYWSECVTILLGCPVSFPLALSLRPHSMAMGIQCRPASVRVLLLSFLYFFSNRDPLRREIQGRIEIRSHLSWTGSWSPAVTAQRSKQPPVLGGGYRKEIASCQGAPWGNFLVQISSCCISLFISLILNRPTDRLMMSMRRFRRLSRSGKKSFRLSWARPRKLWIKRWKKQKKIAKHTWTAWKQSWRIT